MLDFSECVIVIVTVLPRLKECDLKKGFEIVQDENRSGMRRLPPKSLLGLDRRNKRRNRGALREVGLKWKWPQEACTTMFFLIPKNATSEIPIALMPALIRWWEALRAPEVAKWQ